MDLFAGLRLFAPVIEPLRIGSLFAGIGGLEWGLEAGLAASGVPARTVWQVECNPYARAVLAERWPDAARYDEVRTVTARTLAPVDVLVGGSPCTDLSLIGPRTGLAGARSGLWREYARILGELRPLFVVWENVGGALCPTKDKATGQRTPCAVAAVLRDLHALGYDAVWTVLPAANVGAAHRRVRVFVVGFRPEAPRGDVVLSPEPLRALRLDRGQWVARPGARPGADEPVREIATSTAAPYHQERIEALGNCVVPQVAYVVGRMVAALHLSDATFGAAHPEPSPPEALALSTVRWMRRRLAYPQSPMAQLDPRAWTCPPGIPARQVSALCRTWPPDGVMERGYAYAEGATVDTRVAACATDGCDAGDLEETPGLWPTAIARDWRSGRSSAATRGKNARPLSEVAAPEGFLNPPWVERHMGFPVGWTAIPVGTVAQRKRGRAPC